MDGECDDNERLELIEGVMEGERSWLKGHSEKGGGDGSGGGAVMRAEAGGVSPLLRWKKLSTLLLRMTDLRDKERFSLCN